MADIKYTYEPQVNKLRLQAGQSFVEGMAQVGGTALNLYATDKAQKFKLFGDYVDGESKNMLAEIQQDSNYGNYKTRGEEFMEDILDADALAERFNTSRNIAQAFIDENAEMIRTNWSESIDKATKLSMVGNITAQFGSSAILEARKAAADGKTPEEFLHSLKWDTYEGLHPSLWDKEGNYDPSKTEVAAHYIDIYARGVYMKEAPEYIEKHGITAAIDHFSQRYDEIMGAVGIKEGDSAAILGIQTQKDQFLNDLNSQTADANFASPISLYAKADVRAKELYGEALNLLAEARGNRDSFLLTDDELTDIVDKSGLEPGNKIHEQYIEQLIQNENVYYNSNVGEGLYRKIETEEFGGIDKIDEMLRNSTDADRGQGIYSFDSSEVVFSHKTREGREEVSPNEQALQTLWDRANVYSDKKTSTVTTAYGPLVDKIARQLKISSPQEKAALAEMVNARANVLYSTIQSSIESSIVQKAATCRTQAEYDEWLLGERSMGRLDLATYDKYKDMKVFKYPDLYESVKDQLKGRMAYLKDTKGFLEVNWDTYSSTPDFERDLQSWIFNVAQANNGTIPPKELDNFIDISMQAISGENVIAIDDKSRKKMWRETGTIFGTTSVDNPLLMDIGEFKSRMDRGELNLLLYPEGVGAAEDYLLIQKTNEHIDYPEQEVNDITADAMYGKPYKDLNKYQKNLVDVNVQAGCVRAFYYEAFNALRGNSEVGTHGCEVIGYDYALMDENGYLFMLPKKNDPTARTVQVGKVDKNSYEYASVWGGQNVNNGIRVTSSIEPPEHTFPYLVKDGVKMSEDESFALIQHWLGNPNTFNSYEDRY